MATSAWTPVDETAAKWTPVDESPKGQTQDHPGVVKQIWDWANKGLVSGDTLLNVMGHLSPPNDAVKKEMLPGESYAQFIKRYASSVPTQDESNHPIMTGITKGLAGAVSDAYGTASSFTSPVSLATVGAGAATKLPGAVGTAAKVASAAAAGGFGAKGAADVVKNAPAAFQGNPDAAQAALAGGSMVAGSAAGAGELAKSSGVGTTMQDAAAGMYRRTLKPAPGTYTPAEAADLVKTGLNAGIPISEEGLAKLSSLTQNLRNQVAAKIGAGAKAGQTINKFDVASRLNDTTSKLANQVNPEADLDAVSNSGNEFLRNQPANIPVSDAQSLKTGTYQQIRKNYGTLSSGAVEAQKALARGIKEELEIQFPEIKQLNSQEGKFIGLDDALQRAVSRTSNHNWLSLGGKITTAGFGAAGASAGAMLGGGEGAAIGTLASSTTAAVLHHVMTDPAVQSKLAIALNKGGMKVGSVPYSAARQRVAAYIEALGNSTNQSEQPADKDGQQ